MKTSLTILFLFLHSSPSNAAFDQLPHGSRSAALGSALVALAGNEWAVFSNPALLRTIQGRLVSLSYAPQPFELRELARAAASYIEPTSIGTFSISASRFGFELYRETRLSLSFSDDLTDIVKGGLSLNYYSLSIQNYGSAASFGVDIGLIVEISDALRWGFAAFNLNAPTIGAAKEKLPQMFSTGVSFEPVRDAVIVASIVKDIRYVAEFHFGVEYTLVDMLSLRAGTTSDPNTLNAGVGIFYSFMRLDYAFSSHYELGVTHQFSVSLHLGDL